LPSEDDECGDSEDLESLNPSIDHHAPGLSPGDPGIDDPSPGSRLAHPSPTQRLDNPSPTHHLAPTTAYTDMDIDVSWPLHISGRQRWSSGRALA